jgi:hypothetical protein
MKTVDWTDKKGRKFRSLLPDDVPDSEAAKGVLVGPPDITSVLKLKEPLSTDLHNALYESGLFTTKDIKRQPNVLQGVLQRVLGLSVTKIYEAYQSLETETAIE